jgi:hypothetical protein
MPLKAGDRLNYLSSDVGLRSFDAQNATLQQSLRELLKDKYTPDVLKGSNFFKGEILRIEKERSINETLQGGFLSSFFGSNSITMKAYKIRIPELHAHLPVPTDYGSIIVPPNLSNADKIKLVTNNKIIDLYPTFFEFNPNDPLNANITVGNIVWCLFMNSHTLEEPYLFRKVIEEINPSAGAFTVGQSTDERNKNPFTPPLKLDAPPPDMPQGFNDKYIIDYSCMIDFMGSTKGWRYLWQTYDTSAGSCNPPFAGGQRGVDCAGLVRKWILFCELFNRKGVVDRIPSMPGKSLEYQINMSQGQTWRQLFVEIPDGEQLPGDHAVLKYTVGGGHSMIVATYPDKDKHSYVWNSLGKGSSETGFNQYAYVGRRSSSGKEIIFGLEKPKKFGAGEVTYLRIAWSTLTPTFQAKAKAAGVKIEGEKWWFEGPMVKDWPNQYAYPKKISALPDAVIAAPSKFSLHTGKKLIHLDSER